MLSMREVDSSRAREGGREGRKCEGRERGKEGGVYPLFSAAFQCLDGGSTARGGIAARSNFKWLILVTIYALQLATSGKHCTPVKTGSTLQRQRCHSS